MKRSLNSNSKSLAYGFAAVLLGSALLVPIASANDDAIVQTAAGVTYVSGGVGADSIARLTALAGDFNFKLVFALNAGAYLSGVKVTIADAAGKTILDTTSEGPWFLTRLPKGNYQVVASFAGKAEKRRVSFRKAA